MRLDSCGMDVLHSSILQSHHRICSSLENTSDVSRHRKTAVFTLGYTSTSELSVTVIFQCEDIVK